MYNRAVLYIGTVAYADGVDVTSQNRAEPYAAACAYHYITYHCGVIGQKTVLSYLGCKTPN
jgi:hypothetical protein